MEINITKADTFNFVTGMEYLKDLLTATDVSDDFAPDSDTKVTGWELLTNTPVYHALLLACEEEKT